MSDLTQNLIATIVIALPIINYFGLPSFRKLNWDDY